MAAESPAGGPDRAFVVVVHDPVTDEVDAYGPTGEWDALLDAERRRRELDAEELDDVHVLLVPLAAGASRASSARPAPVVVAEPDGS
ncbi:hypothetical protein [Actinomycetospora sp. CA-084318]|uniref:hypothetical protein n=1 Tax=Actinomycetospora sp. CA-084318 TaxID=3239892 RepID=UPI003D976FB7